jgi:NAD(P)-dependent dehydrogenase (short-subunit alcohol dehydrogenase family)
MFSLADKTAVVTGGSRGIGESVSRILASAGCQVHILALQEPVGQPGDLVRYHPCDITDNVAVEKVFSEIAGSHTLDILVNNAGIAHVGNIESTTSEDFDRVFSVNVKGAFHCLAAAIRHMKAGGGGSIVNIASIAAMVGLSDRFAYSASKGAILSMTYSIAKDYLSDNIRCNSISPGRVHTPFVDGFLSKNYPGREQEMFDKLSRTQPVGRMGKPDEIAALVLYLCSDEAAFITGSNYTIDGGLTTLNT